MKNGTIALVFPGQGSQQPGMGRDFFEAFPESRRVYEEADSVLGRSISRICFEGAEEDLRRTENTQPALYVTSAAMLAAFRARGFDGAFTAGHSLGEYTALHAAGALDFATGLRLVNVRARAMERAGRQRPGIMAALLGSDPETLAVICQEASSVGVVVLANLNSPQQSVISGEEVGIDRAIELAKRAGVKRAIKLNVGGAFHSPLMASAAAELSEALSAATIQVPRLSFVANVSAREVSDSNQIRQLLTEQLVRCVLWSRSVDRMCELGARDWIEIGPGSVLTGLIRRINPQVNTHNLSSAKDLEGIQEAWSAPCKTDKVSGVTKSSQ